MNGDGTEPQPLFRASLAWNGRILRGVTRLEVTHTRDGDHTVRETVLRMGIPDDADRFKLDDTGEFALIEIDGVGPLRIAETMRVVGNGPAPDDPSDRLVTLRTVIT